MSFLNRLKDQVNPFDGGKSFGNQGQPQAQQGGNIPFKNGLYPAPYNPMAVQQAQGTQPAPRMAEDDYTPSDALENTGYFNPQTSLNGEFMHQGGYNPQTTVDNSKMEYLRKLLGY